MGGCSSQASCSTTSSDEDSDTSEPVVDTKAMNGHCQVNTRILPAAMLAHNIPAEEEDTASVISVASSGAAAQKRATETDSDASQASKDDAQTEVGSVEEVPTDEDESELESEEEFELSEKEQRLLHEAYDTYATTGQQWTRERQSSSANCRTSFADAGNVRSVVEKLTDLPDSWPLMRILIPLDGLSLQIERIIACVAAELSATHLEAKTLGKFVKRVAKKLTAMLACYLAGEVASILSPVAAIGHREMVAPMYHPLLTPGFWVRPIYIWSFCTPRQGSGETQESKRRDRQQGL